MKYLLFIMLPFIMSSNSIFDFNKDSDLSNWFIVDDGVMGGLSDGQFQINEKGHGRFYGDVSLENNGGFTMLQYYFERIEVKQYDFIVVKLKGDGKKYQFRVKVNREDQQSYVINFETTGEWQEVKIPLKDLAPTFRGRVLEMPYFPNASLEMIAFLIGNKRAESFELLIDRVELL